MNEGTVHEKSDFVATIPSQTASVVGNVVWAHRPGTQRGCVGIGSGDVVLRRLIKLMTELIELCRLVVRFVLSVFTV